MIEPLETSVVFHGGLSGTIEATVSLGDIPPADLWESIVRGLRWGERLEEVLEYLAENPETAKQAEILFQLLGFG